MPPRPFAPPGTRTNFVGDRPFRLEHARLEWEIDLAARRLLGTAILTVVARRAGLGAVSFDAVDLDVESVTVEGRPAGFDNDGQKLRVALDAPPAEGTPFEVAVRYSCRPRRGLYFVGPDAAHPDRAAQCWTQGQDDDARCFLPCLDQPIEKFTTEVICTAPAGLFVLSNGDLRERTDLPGGRATRWHYALALPQPAYLLTLVVGPFAELADRAPQTGADVYAFCAPGREADARRSVARTGAMIDHFSEKIGVPYPHARYSQIFVPEFIFGGMENTSATTLTDLTLLDERAALDHDVDGLVSHELAHQWWGDLLTCREWSEAWLNEGFATYFEYVWREHAKGRDEADHELLADTDGYLAEAGRYQRPVVCRQYDEPIHLFDAHLYEKGGRVLHMLRHELGEAAFWRAIGHYAKKHAGGSVETRDLARAIEEVSGRGVERLLDRWIARPGHPELEGRWSWDDDRRVGTLALAQKQAVTPEAPPFEFSATVRFEIDGRTHDERVAVREAAHSFELALPGRPTQAIFDPGDVLLKTIKLDKPAALWRRQLAAAALGVDRILAARALADLPDPANVAALVAALGDDPFWGVRGAAARALGKTRRDEAREALCAAKEAPEPRVRRAVAAGLGEFSGDERAARALADWLRAGDPSVFVEAEAALALGRTRSPRALELLPPLVDRPSFQAVLASRAIDGLGKTGDERAFPLIRDAWRPGAPFPARRAVVAALAELARGTGLGRAAREAIEPRLRDGDFRVRLEAAVALGRLGLPDALPAIRGALAGELDGRTKRRMNEAIRDIEDGARPAEEARRLHDEVERLRGETAKLRERLDRLEARDAPPPATSPPPAKSKRPRPVTRRSRSGRPVRR
ncbi:MAG TPA: M1 family aminopeptidase [Polyangia bacterium]|jgi:aminopeptidase N|nr:M1 family aminopeptidase [Polyangia bacterium]